MRTSTGVHFQLNFAKYLMKKCGQLTFPAISRFFAKACTHRITYGAFVKVITAMRHREDA